MHGTQPRIGSISVEPQLHNTSDTSGMNGPVESVSEGRTDGHLGFWVQSQISASLEGFVVEPVEATRNTSLKSDIKNPVINWPIHRPTKILGFNPASGAKVSNLHPD